MYKRQDQCDVCTSVWIVLDTDNGCRDTILAVSLKINNSVFSSAAAASVTNSDLTLIVTTSVLVQGYYQRFLRSVLCDFLEIRTPWLWSDTAVRGNYGYLYGLFR